MKLKLLAVAAAAAALVSPAAAAEAGKGQLSRPTFIDPEVVAQLPHNLAQQMIRDRDTFYVPDSAEVVGAPKRMRFAEARAERPTPIASAKPPAAAAKPAAAAATEEEEEPRRETRRSASDDARRRRDYAAWEMRRQELEAVQVEQRLAAEQPRFQQVQPQQQRAPRAADDEDEDGQDTDDDLTPAQAQLENNRRRARQAERQAAVDQARRQASQNAAMRFAEARRAARPLVRAYPPSPERGTADLAGNVMQSRLARAAARRQERARAESRPQVLLETGAERPRRRMFEMSPEELHAAFQAHRAETGATAEAAPPVARREAERREAGPSGMPRMAPPPAPRRQAGDAALLEEHGIRVTHYEPPVRA